MSPDPLMAIVQNRWNLGNPPPAGHHDVGRFAVGLWERAKKEKIERLDMHNRFDYLHGVYRGKNLTKKYPNVGIRPEFKTVQGHSAFLTERVPLFELQNKSVPDDWSTKALAKDLTDWWHDQEVEAQLRLYESVLNMSIYGTKISKAVWNDDEYRPNIIVKDAYGCFPAPGYKMCDMKLPYFCDAFLMPIWEVRKKFEIPDEIIIPAYSPSENLFGEDRETVKTGTMTSGQGRISHYASNYVSTSGGASSGENDEPKALVIEVWIKDHSGKKEPIIEKIPTPDALGRTSENAFTEQQVGTKFIPNYLDGIRKITICPKMIGVGSFNSGVLDDSPNPSISWTLVGQRIAALVQNGVQQPVTDPVGNVLGVQAIPVSMEDATNMVVSEMKNCFLWGRFPYCAVPAFIDTATWWGFSILEQIEVLCHAVKGLLKRYYIGHDRAMFPTLLLPVGCGIDGGSLENMPGRYLTPTTITANLLRFLDQPPPHQSILAFAEFLLMQIDITSMSPEVTEGRRPKGIQAAAAIIALQEKAASLFQPQIRSVDTICRTWNDMWISLVRNFSHIEKVVDVEGEQIPYVGSSITGRILCVVESGSTAPITKIGRRQQAVELRKMGDMDLESLLDALEIPNKHKIIERLAEQNSLAGAIDVLIQAGLPEEIGMQLFQELLKDQGGTGRARPGRKQPGKTGANQVAGPPKGSSEGIQDAYKQMQHTEGVK